MNPDTKTVLTPSTIGHSSQSAVIPPRTSGPIPQTVVVPGTGSGATPRFGTDSMPEIPTPKLKSTGEIQKSGSGKKGCFVVTLLLVLLSADGIWLTLGYTAGPALAAKHNQPVLLDSWLWLPGININRTDSDGTPPCTLPPHTTMCSSLSVCSHTEPIPTSPTTVDSLPTWLQRGHPGTYCPPSIKQKPPNQPRPSPYRGMQKPCTKRHAPRK